jgi:DNA-binding PadR family transcriptional regulator
MVLPTYSLLIQQEKELRVKHVKDCMEEIALRLLLTGELHGYKFKKYLEDRNNFSVYVSPSEAYPILWSLEKRGIINSKIEKIGERKRVVYSPIPFITRNYLKAKRNAENRNRVKINKIGGESLSFQFAAPMTIEVKEEQKTES